MKAIEVAGNIDPQRRLSADVPNGLPPGPVRILVAPPGEDDAWLQGIASEWSNDLADPRQDLYTLEDGHPLDVSR